ncbi:MAG: hydrogenase small subunit [Armatimonadetes bacterium]|nr:hydrogenase small subunit [Armatimonadota bacterium]
MAKAQSVKEHPAIWFQASACSGCVVSALNGVAPNIRDLVVDQIAPGHHVSLKFLPTIMAGAGKVAVDILATTEESKEAYLLVIDGALPTAANGLFGRAASRDGGESTMYQRAMELAEKASAIIALGTCAGYGGMHAASPNPSGCIGVKAALDREGIEKPLVNVPGCPPHPDWFTGTVGHALLFGWPSEDELDAVGRPKRFFGRLLHDLCQRRGDFEAHRFAKAPGEPGCLYELGCKGPWTHADCPEREFNGGVSWCVKAGSPCQGCVEPFFPDVASPIYQKIGLPELPRVAVDAATGQLAAVMRPQPAEEE